jgi:polyphosphate glucokinase
MKVLVVDVGGTHVKILATGQAERREFESGPDLTVRQMVAGVKRLAKDWRYDAVSVGYPGLVLKGRIAAEPHNLAAGWTGFDFEKAFRRPVKVVNDAAMQALGSYTAGTMLFLGLGTGLGSALVVDGHLVPLELAHLAYKSGTIEDYVGLRGLERLGKKKWREHVAFMVERFTAAMHPDEIVIGGGNAKKLKQMPPGCRMGDNSNAFLGGFRLWERNHTAKRKR